MERREHHVLKLLRNRLYPTYQLYAVMASKKTAPRDGLRLGALTVMEWLRQRLQDGIPPELDQPEPALFRQAGDECLRSMHMNFGFVVDIVSLPEQGVWTLQVTEPDLGSDPGNPDQARQPVPGRVIETNIGFRVSGTALECGFQCLISDPEVTPAQAEVYRLAVVRRLMEDPDFGLRQISPLGFEAERIGAAEQVKRLLSLQREDANQLPAAVFTHARRESVPREMPPMPAAQPLLAGRAPKLELGGPGRRLPLERLAEQKPAPERKPQAAAETFLPYDAAGFARETAAFCRTFILDDGLLERFGAACGATLEPGDVLLLEPEQFGGGRTVFPLKPSKARREETLERLRELTLNYPRGKVFGFGGVVFLSSARQSLLEASRDALRQGEEADRQHGLELAMEQERWNAALTERENECHALREQLARQREYQARLEQEKAALRERHQQELDALQARIEDRDEMLRYYRRKLSQPREHGQIAEWAAKNFEGRLLLHPRAVSLLEEKSAQTVDVGLICDALDFLATDYWDNRYLRVPEDEMHTRCSRKYGRPFEIKPTGEATINFTPAQYRIKYFPSPLNGKPADSDLDYHLRVGNDPEILLRIYFLHDDEKRLIVVGSLPKHLRGIMIKG